MVCNCNCPVQRRKGKRCADLGGLTDSDYFPDRLAEQFFGRSIRCSPRKERFQFVKAEFGEAEAVTPDHIRLGLIVLCDQDVVVGDEFDKAAVLPIGRIKILLGRHVMSRSLCQEYQASGKSCREQDGIRHVAWGHHGRSNGADLIMFPCQLVFQAGHVR